ncbi:MAG: VWA domain-containing protein, partial [Pedosphaera parvula]|nr:VWA domain-containing protein [Pedosphaera parvula]
LLVVILDNSASMQSTDESPSRFEKARSEALRLVDAMHDNDQMILLQAGAITEVKQSPTAEKAILRRKLQNTAVSDTPTRLAEALKLAETLTRNNVLAEIHLFSDGADSQLDGFDNKGLPLFYHRIGKRSENLGIITIDVRPHPEDPTKRTVFAGIANFSSRTEQTQIELSFNGQLLEVKPVSLRPGETSPQVFSIAQKEDGVFTVRLGVQDDLAADNQASIVSLLPEPLQVLLVTAGNRLLEKALRVHPHMAVSVTGSLTDPGAAFDLIVLDNIQPVFWPAVNTLAFQVANPNWFESVSRLEAPAIVDWKSTHPLLRGVTFDNVLISESLGAKAPPWAVPLVDSPQASLILAGESGRQRIVWIGFDVLQSTWPLRVSFPIFMANALDWLDPLPASTSQLTLRAGDPFRLF